MLALNRTMKLLSGDTMYKTPAKVLAIVAGLMTNTAVLATHANSGAAVEGLEEIVVTAQKRAQNLMQRIPRRGDSSRPCIRPVRMDFIHSLATWAADSDTL
jgi:hypothetical protein